MKPKYRVIYAEQESGEGLIPPAIYIYNLEELRRVAKLFNGIYEAAQQPGNFVLFTISPIDNPAVKKRYRLYPSQIVKLREDK